MKLYLAPLEGITSYIYRKALYQCFDGFDKYFIPFIRAKQNLNFSGREKKDISPENNSGMYAVPQILTRNADDFLRTANQLKEYGYQEVNLNLGCPSKTVVTKGCGAGFLARPEELEQFLDRIFSKTDMKISVKTRLGMENAEEFPRLMEIYNRFPMEELIIHPRVQKDFYKNTPNLEAFGEALAISKNPVCYNGDIFTLNSYNKIINEFPEVNKVMLGRGILANPGLIGEIKNNEFANKEIIKMFHDEIFEKYTILLNEDKNAMYRMKELWGYMSHIFTNNKKYYKKIKKAQKAIDYKNAVNSLFIEQDIIKGAGLFNNEV